PRRTRRRGRGGPAARRPRGDEDGDDVRRRGRRHRARGARRSRRDGRRGRAAGRGRSRGLELPPGGIPTRGVATGARRATVRRVRILVLDDDAGRAAELALVAERGVPGAHVACTSGAPLVAVDAGRPDVVIVGPGPAGRADVAQLVRELRERRANAAILVIGDRDAADAAVLAMQAGASEYAVARSGAPLAAVIARLASATAGPVPVRRAPAAIRAPARADAPYGLVGASRAIEHVRTLVRAAAHTEAHVLIEGETGTGKEVVARAVHAGG